MLQCTVWHWYQKLLESYTNTIPWKSIWDRQLEIKSPQASMKALLECGASLYSQSPSGHTILDGLLLNLTQFDGEPRTAEALASCMATWISVLLDLDFNINNYIQHERKLHEGRSHDLGLGILMEARFDENRKPHIWSVFQGPEERERNDFVDHISKCARWKTWQLTFTLPKPPPSPRPARILTESAEIVILKGDPASSLMQTPSPTGGFPEIFDKKTLSSYLTKSSRISLLYLEFAAQHRYEFSLYVFILSCLLGCRYLARFCMTLGFYLMLKLVLEFI